MFIEVTQTNLNKIYINCSHIINLSQNNDGSSKIKLINGDEIVLRENYINVVSAIKREINPQNG
ncbi:flagellar FlbD family protein [Chryseobacterium arthrosphaerae]|uniref:flagellar FlbD family protein n=1 Tax=Chryseobacterium arthrosphaerae TaxID=651561 RepID=UPI0035E4587E|nr:flagellar FlbD family protein [Chryseobacterium arthrosphaerae]